MSYKIPDSMRETFKSNPITYVTPEPKIETEPQPDGSIKSVVGWDMKGFAYAVSAIVRQMNEAFDDAIVEEFAALNGYVKEHTCRIEGTYSDEYAIYDHLTCGHVNLRHWPEPTSYCSTCGAKVAE